MNRKSYEILRGKIKTEVTELEETVVTALDSVWTDDVVRTYYAKLMSLTLSDRRLWLVYSLLNHSIIKTSEYFKVDRKTVSNNINRIKNELI